MPEEYGGSPFSDGTNQINLETVKAQQMIPGKTYSYDYRGWPCYEERYATELSKAWSEEYANGASTGIELYRNTGKASVVPPAAISYTKATPSDDAQQKRSNFAPVMKEYSWKCVMSESDAEFDENWAYMVKTCKDYGYDDVVAEKMEDIQNCFAYIDANQE